MTGRDPDTGGQLTTGFQAMHLDVPKPRRLRDQRHADGLSSLTEISPSFCQLGGM